MKTFWQPAFSLLTPYWFLPHQNTSTTVLPTFNMSSANGVDLERLKNLLFVREFIFFHVVLYQENHRANIDQRNSLTVNRPNYHFCYYYYYYYYYYVSIYLSSLPFAHLSDAARIRSVVKGR